MLTAITFFVSIAAGADSAHGDNAESDAVASLPDLDGALPADSMYSGYLPVGSTGRHLFYIFVRSQASPHTDPVLFWTNGGPGCSSVGEGFWMEHGPYLVSNTVAGVVKNPFSWSRLASVLYLEHPVGVGFSYSENAADYAAAGDDRNADDVYEALIAFIERYPDFAPQMGQRPFYLSGESYGGEYVPHLAHRILTGSNARLRDALAGFIVANPVFYCKADASGHSATLQYQMLYMHGLMSYAQFAKWAAMGCDTSYDSRRSTCDALQAEANQAIGTVNQQLHKRQRLVRLRAAGALPGKAEPMHTDDLVEANFDPDHKYQSFCLGNATLAFATQPNADTESGSCNPLGDPGRMATYLNRRDVQAALHVRPGKAASEPWTACAGDWLKYNATGRNVLTAYYEPIFRMTDASRFHVLVVSGDEDIATIPYANTAACLAELSESGAVRRIGPWRPWTVNGITAGYWESFDRYTFATVKGAGHTVPQYQPLTTFELLSWWFRNVSLTQNQAPGATMVV